jgi:hypothetical protein
MRLLTDGIHVCDARCYDAKWQGEECHCCCGGVNHAVGFQEASKNTCTAIEMMQIITGNQVTPLVHEYQLELFPMSEVQYAIA